jgi:hypothetical protein
MRNSEFYRVNFEKEIVVQGRTTLFLSIEANDPDPSTNIEWVDGETLWVSPYIQPQTFETKFEALTQIPEDPMPQPNPAQFRFYFTEFAKRGKAFEQAAWNSIQIGDDVKAASMFTRTPPGVSTASPYAGPLDVMKFQAKVVEKGRYLIGGTYYYYVAIDAANAGSDQVSGEGFMMQIGNWKEDDNWQINQISAAVVAEQTLRNQSPVYYETTPIGPNQFDGQSSTNDWPNDVNYFTRIVSSTPNPWSSYRKNLEAPNPPRITYRIDYDGIANSHLKINFLVAKTSSSSVQPFLWGVNATMSGEIQRSTVNYGQKLAQPDLDSEHLIDYHEVHLFGYPETSVKTSRTTYQNEFSATGSEIYDDLSSYGVLKTNPKLTGNVKLTVDSGGSLWLNSIDASEELSSSRFKKYAISSNSTYQRDLFYFLDQGKLSPELLYQLYQKDNQYLNTKRSLSEQYDNFYNYGIEQLNSKFYDEDYTFLAPLWMRKQLPEFFVIFRLDHPLNPLSYQNTSNPEKFQEFFKDARIVKTFDMRVSSPLGSYLRKIVDDPRFNERPLEVSFSADTPTTWYGIDYTSGNITGKGEFLNDFWASDNRILDFEETITGGFERNSLISTNLINLEFLFSDTEATPYSINRYFGFYVTENQLAEFEIVPEILGAISGQTPAPKLGVDGAPYNLQPFVQTNPIGIQLPVDYFHNPADGTINTSATPEYVGLVNGKLPLPSMVDDPLRFFYVKDRFGNFKRVNRLQELNYGTPGSPSFKRVTQLQLFDNQENISDFGGITQLSSQSNADLLPGGNAQVVLAIEDLLKNGVPIADYETIEISLEKLNSEPRTYYYRITIADEPFPGDIEITVQKNNTGIFGALPEDYYATIFTQTSSPAWIDSYLLCFIAGMLQVGDYFDVAVENGNIVSANRNVGATTEGLFYGAAEFLQYRWILEANPVGLSPGESWDYSVYDPQTRDYKNTFCNRGTPAQVAEAIANCINSFETCIVTAKSIGDYVYIKSLENFETGNKISIKRNLKENISVPRNTGFYEKGNANRGSFTADAFTGRIDSIDSIVATATGYTPGTYYGLSSTVSPTGGEGAKFNVIVDGSGDVTSVTIVYGGFGYSQFDTVSIARELIGGLPGSANVELAINVGNYPALNFEMNEYTPIYRVTEHFISATKISADPEQWSINIRKDVDPANPSVTGSAYTYITAAGAISLDIEEYSLDLTNLSNFSTLVHFEWGADHLNQYFVGGVQRNRARAAVSFADGKRYYSDRTTSFVGSVSSGSDQITSVSFPNNLYIGAPITGSGIPTGTLIVEIKETLGVIVLSKNVTETLAGATFKAGEVSILNTREIYQQWFQVQKGNYSRLRGWDVQGKYVYSLPYLENPDFSDYNIYSIIQIDKDRDEFYFTLDKKIVAYQVYRPTFGIFSLLPVKTFDVDTYFSEYSYAPTVELLRYFNREEVGSAFVPFVGNVTAGSDTIYNIVFPNELIVGMPLRDSTFAVGGPYIEDGTVIIDILPDTMPSPSIKISKPALASSLSANLAAGTLNFTQEIPLNMGENYDISIIAEDYTGSADDTINLELTIEFYDNNDKKWKFIDQTLSTLHIDPLAGSRPIAQNPDQSRSLQTVMMNTSYPPYFYDFLEIPNDYLGDANPPLGPFNAANPQGANTGQDNQGPQYTAVGTRNFVRKLLYTDGLNESFFTKARISAIHVWGDYATQADPTNPIKYKIRVEGSNYYKDPNITRFAGFSSLTDFLTESDLEAIQRYSDEQSFEKYTYQMLLSEYDRLRENQQKDLAVKSKVVPSILKWVQEGTDARDNYYRLNNSSAFGITNFSPDPEVDFTEPLLLTHEFPYLDNVPKDYPEETLEGSRSYFFQKLSDVAYQNKSWYELLTADNTKDWFTKYFVVGYPNEISQAKDLVTKNREERYTFFKYINGLDLSQTLFRGAKINVIDYDTTVTPKIPINESKRFDLYKFAAIARFVTHHNFEEEKPIDIEIINNEVFKTILVIVTIHVQDYRLQAGLGDYSFFYYAIDQLRNSMQTQTVGGYGTASQFFRPVYENVSDALDQKYPMEVPYTTQFAEAAGYLNVSNYFYNDSGVAPWSYYAEDVPKAFSIMRPRQLLLGGGRLELDDAKLGGKTWIGGWENSINDISKFIFQPLSSADGTAAYPFVDSSINYYPVYQEVFPTLDNYRTSIDYYLGGWQDAYNNAVTASTTTGSNTLTSVVIPNFAYPGAIISGFGIPAGTTIVSISSTGDIIEISQNATATSSGVELIFSARYGSPFFSSPVPVEDYPFDATSMTVDGFLSELGIASRNLQNNARDSRVVYNSKQTTDDIRLDFLTFSTPDTYRSFRVSDIIDSNSKAIVSTSVGFVNIPENFPSYPPYQYISASNNFVINPSYTVYQTFNLRGGSLFYQYRKNFISFASISKMFNQQSNYILHRKITSVGSQIQTVPDFSLQFVEFDRIKKISRYFYSDDIDKPLEYENTEFIGYDLVKTKEQEYEFRHRGLYEPKTLEVVSFWAREDESFTRHFERDYVLKNTHINSASSVAGLMRNYFYNKVANQEVLRIARTSAYKSLYPLIGEVSIDKRDLSAIDSSWDANFYRRYRTTAQYEDMPGTEEMQETKVFLASKVMSVPRIFEFQTFIPGEADHEVIQPQKTIGVTTISSPNTVENNSLQTFPVLQIRLNLRDRLRRALLEGIASSDGFDEFAWFNSLGIAAITYTQDELDVLKLQYIEKNIIPLYEVSEILLYANSGEGLPIFETELTEAEKLLAGYRTDSNFKNTSQGSFQFLLEKTLDTKAANAYSVSAVLKRI